MAIKLPDKIKVAGYDMKVVEWCPHAAGATQKYGEFSSHEMTIRVDTSSVIQRTLDILLHEIYHAIFWAYGIENEDKEERIVNIFSTAMNQIYRDNPDLLRFINESVEVLNNVQEKET